MEIEIRKLTPDLAEEYVHFFDVTPHDLNIDERKCYCVTWRSDDSYEDGNHWYPTREERRTRALQFVRDGSLQGYLAYHGGKIVGWCNASADCRLCVDYLRSFWPIEEYSPDVRIKSVFCFVIAPDMQRKGIATRLLERVCKDAAEDGFDYVEAYVNKEFIEADHDFRGPLAMYDKCGFTRYAERDGRVVVRKALK
jgi:GNAT superfamily N-acetyltransferase